MGMPYFIFNGVNSLDMGVVVNKLPPIFLPERNVDLIEVQGRDGFLTQDFDTYKPIVKSIECTLMDNENIDSVIAWLGQTHGKVIFSNQQDKFYKCMIKNQIPFEQILYKISSFIIQFDCQPFGYLKDETPITWTNNLLTGLSGDTYDLNKIWSGSRSSIREISVIDSKKWIKYLHDTSNGGVPALVLDKVNLKPNTTYTYSFNVYTLGEFTSLRCYNNDGGVYNRKVYSISKLPIRINHTFTTRESTAYDMLHIIDLNPGDVYYFSDFKLEEGDITKVEGRNLIPLSYVQLPTDGTITIDKTGFTGYSWGATILTNEWVVNFLQPNTEYTMSYDITLLSKSDKPIFKQRYGGFILYNSLTFKGMAELTLSQYENMRVGDTIHLANTFTTPSDLSNYRVLCYTARHTDGATVELAQMQFSNVKLEKGNKATEWTPAPEDNRLYIENKGTRPSKPTITIYGNGDINLYINKETIKLKNIEEKITINTEMMECYKDTLPCNNKMYGEFPILSIGQNNITWTGSVNRIEVQPNTVFL